MCARAGTIYAVQETANLLQCLHQVAPPLPLALDARLHLGPRACLGAALTWADATLPARCTAVGGLRMLREMLRDSWGGHTCRLPALAAAGGVRCCSRATLPRLLLRPRVRRGAGAAPTQQRAQRQPAGHRGGLLQVPDGTFRIVQYNVPFYVKGSWVVPLNAYHSRGSTSYLVFSPGYPPKFLSGDFRCAPAPPALAAATACDRVHAPVFCQGEHEPGGRPLGWAHCGGGGSVRGAPAAALVGCMQACHATPMPVRL